MPAVSNLGTWLSPNSVAIMSQPPVEKFAAFLLTQVSIPSADRVRFDLIESERHGRSFQVTRNPVERVTAQNKIRNPDTLNITGMLSANPLVSPLTHAGIARPDRRELAKLRTLISRPGLLFVVTPERTLPNMTCVGFNEVYDENTGQGVRITMQLAEMQIVAPGLVDSVLDEDNLGLGAGSTSDLGTQSTNTVPDPGEQIGLLLRLG